MSSFQIFSSLRYDPSLPEASNAGCNAQHNSCYYLLPFHHNRLIRAATHFQWPQALAFLEGRDLARELDGFIPDRTKPWRLRITLNCNGDFSVEANPAAPVPATNFLIPTSKSTLPVWRVHVDSMQPVQPSAFTTHKTTVREQYNAARLRMGILSLTEPAEVLVTNARGEVMEGSITTPYFRSRSPTAHEWITPPLSSGGNAGTTRRFALALGFCREEVIHASDLVDGEECWLSNGVRGFIPGVVVHHLRNI